MSLRNRLWLGLGLVMLVTMLGTWSVQFWGSQQLLREQLRVKNIDNATILALTLSQFVDEPVTREVFLSAQFDAGHYQNIRLFSSDDRVLFERSASASVSVAPSWFQSMFPLEVEPGMAQVQQGWKQLGRLEVQSHSGYAYAALWDSAQRILLWFVVVSVVAGGWAAWALSRTLQPLALVVDQAQAVASRRFPELDQPRILEFRQLVAAMNQMAQSVRGMLNRDAQRIEALRAETELDPVTGLLLRKVFQQRLQSSLDERLGGYLISLELANLLSLNQQHGHPAVDALLAKIGVALNVQGRELVRGRRWMGGRLGGSEVVLFLERVGNIHTTAEQLCEHLQTLALDANMNLQMHVAVVDLSAAGDTAEVFRAMDRGLAEAVSRGTVVELEAGAASDGNPSERRQELQAALQRNDRVRLQAYPVKRHDGGIERQDAYVEVELGGQWLSAAEVLPWVHRLGLDGDLNRRVIDVALTESRHAKPLALQLSMEAVTEVSVRDDIMRALSSSPLAAQRLYLDVPECGAQHDLQLFRQWVESLRGMVAGVGIRHGGYAPDLLQNLSDLGISHVKLDAALVQTAQDAHVMAVIGGYCSMAHSMGIQVTASGVNDAALVQRLFQLGVDGLTGPAC
nr:EAL domain-containing protein [Oceanococcus sp. HetDA_MAG_MS8]